MSNNRCLAGQKCKNSRNITVFLLVTIFAGGSLLLSVTPCAVATITEWGDEQWYHWSYADFNYDFIVDFNDLADLAADWLTPGYISDKDGPGTDINKDGMVNLFDFVLYANEFGRNAEDEFGYDHGKIMVAIRKGYDLEATEPEIGSKIKVQNISTGVLTDYEINKIISNVGMNQGITGFAQIDLFWEYDFQTDRNKIVQWTTGPFYERIRVPGYKVFVLYSKGGTGEDPNNLVFEDKLIEAETSVGYYCNTVNAPMPHNKK